MIRMPPGRDSAAATRPSTAAWMFAAGTPSRTLWMRSTVSGSWEMKIRASIVPASFSAAGAAVSFMGVRPAGVPAELDPDSLEDPVLDGLDGPGPDELEQAEKGHQGLLYGVLAFEVLQEIERPLGLEDAHDLLHLVVER